MPTPNFVFPITVDLGPAEAASTVYIVFYAPDGTDTVWNGTSFVAPSSSAFENGSATGVHVGNGVFTFNLPEALYALVPYSEYYPYRVYREEAPTTGRDPAIDTNLSSTVPYNLIVFIGKSRIILATQLVANNIALILTENQTVERLYTVDFPDPDLIAQTPDLLAEFTGKRKIYVNPLEEPMVLATNTEDYANYGIGITILERYPGTANQPPVAWVDERVAWVEKLFDRLTNPRDTEIITNSTPIKENSTFTVYNIDYLTQLKLFYSEMILNYKQIVEVPNE